MTASNQPTVEETLDALALITEPSLTQTGITGIVQAFGKNSPRSLAGINMPCVVWLPGPVQPDYASDGEDADGTELYLTRIYYGILIVAPNNVGQEGETFADAIPFIDRFWDFFLAHQSLGGIGVYLMRMMSDTGVRNDIVYAGQQATGVRFELAVTSQKRAEFADYE